MKFKDSVKFDNGTNPTFSISDKKIKVYYTKNDVANYGEIDTSKKPINVKIEGQLNYSLQSTPIENKLIQLYGFEFYIG